MHDSTASLLSRAVLALCDGDESNARMALGAIDYHGLVAVRAAAMEPVWGAGGVGLGQKKSQSAKRQPTKVADVRASFVRDRYTCRYAHCRRATIALEILKLLSKGFPDLIPYKSNWKPLERHILYWVYSTSVEHRVPFAAGGTSEAANLITACYLCNDVKNCVPIEVLGWTVADPPDSDWAGLTEHITALRAAVGRIALRNSGA